MTNTELVASGGETGIHEFLDDHDDYLTVYVDGQMFGVKAMAVQDILSPRQIAKVPLAPKAVAGSINLRGRIVTAVDVRTRLGMELNADMDKSMNVVVDVGGDLYSLLVDSVGEVMSISPDTFEKNPSTLDEDWQGFSNGVHRLDGALMVVLDVEKVVRVNA